MMPIKKDNELDSLLPRTKIPCPFRGTSWQENRSSDATKSSRIASTMDADREHRY